MFFQSVSMPLILSAFGAKVESVAAESVHIIDCDYIAPQVAAAYLITEGGRGVFVENNTAHAVPRLLQALRDQRVAPETVDYLIITHVHLDHAGGTSELLRHCPNAKVLAHPRAARTIVDPSRLIASARQVYGEARFENLYGEILPVDAARVRIPEDGEEIRWGNRSFRFIYTRGHANHHFCIVDSGSEGIFTGDSFGLAYPAFQGGGLFLFPSTSPTDFDPDEARLSIAKIRASGAKRAFLTHFGEIPLNDRAVSEILTHLDFTEKLYRQCLASGKTLDEMSKRCKAELTGYYLKVLKDRGTPVEVSRGLPEILELDLDLNAAGIAHSAVKKRDASAKPA